jgi:uncharacterized membrane protein YeiB
MTWSEVWLSNIDQWTLGTASQLFIVPLLAMPPMLLGVVAARLQWLTHARWQAQRARFAKRLLPIALVLNMSAATLYAWGIDQRVKELENLATSLMSFAGPVAVAWFVCWISNLYSKQIIRSCGQLISPLGRYSLSSYLLGSIVMNGLFAGAGLALPASSALLLVLAIAFWCVCLWLAHVATKRGCQGLPERWLSVRSHETKRIN